MSFIWPSGLLALFLIPILVWYYLRQLRVRRFARAVMGSAGSPWQGLQRVSGLRRHLPPFILLLGVSLLVLGLARPQMTVELPRVEGTVVLAFDVSNSMSAEDLQPSRLEAAKAAARSFVENQPTTVRIGVVAFGGSGLTLEKPTQDQAAILAAIDRLGPQGGTSLGEG
ncbi:MAG TPA: VWA domain-containing protein, partial [Anaerolineales bacterium]